MTKPLVLALGALALSVACSSDPKPQPMPPPAPSAPAPPPPAPPPPPADTATAAAAADPKAAMAEAIEIYKGRCSTCHGVTGNADGPAAAALNPKPRKFSDMEWQKTITDDHIEKIIREGGAAVGKSPLMPPNPDLVSKPAVVAELRKIIRGGGTIPAQ